MSLAICPHCQKKLQLPEGMASGTMLQCAGCGSQFLPPEPVLKLELAGGKKKRKRKREKQGVSTNRVVLVSVLVAIVLLLGTLGVLWLMEPSHAKFNEQVMLNYQSFSDILQNGIDGRRINNLQNFLQQFEQLAPKLDATLEAVRKLSAPHDSRFVKETFVSLIDSIQRFGKEEAPDLIKKLKNSKEDQVAQTMVGTLVRIATLHENLIQQQHDMAKIHGLIQIQVPKNRQFFLSRERE